MFREIRGCYISVVAVLSSGVGTAMGMFKLKEDLQAMVQSEDVVSAVARREGLVASMGNAPSHHLIYEAVKLGGRIVSVDVGETLVSHREGIDKNSEI